MDILVVSSNDSVRALGFVQHARENGLRVYRSAPDQRMPRTEQAWLGVVCFGPGISCGALQLLIEDVRYLGAGLSVVGSETKPSIQHDQLRWYTHDTTDAELLQDLVARCRAEPVAPAVRNQVVGPLITAVRQTLVEMAGVEVFVRAAFQRTPPPTTLGDLSAIIALPTLDDGWLILSLGAQTAMHLERRILAEVKTGAIPELLQDCVNEVGNVIAGQAKALLAGTPYHFTFSPPMTTTPELVRFHDVAGVVIAFDSDIGNLALQLSLNSLMTWK